MLLCHLLDCDHILIDNLDEVRTDLVVFKYPNEIMERDL
jgi:hypothetical protein